MTSRLPVPGQDDGTWGAILNDFLNVAHQDDGTIRAIPESTVINLTADLADKAELIHGHAIGDVTGLAAALANKAPSASPTFTGSVSIPSPINDTDAATKAYVDTAAASATPDATAATKGKLRLAGDLSGTATNPTVPALATKANASDLSAHIANTANPHAVTKAQIGLGDVDNTADTNKPVSIATQTALATKADAAAVAVLQAKLDAVTSVVNLGTISTGTINLSSYTYGGTFLVILASNTTITLPAQSAGVHRVFEIVITQDSVGSRVLTYPAGTIGSDGLKPALTTAPGAIDTIAMVQDGVHTKVRLVERNLS